MILISMLINIISVANDAINNVKCQIEIIMPLLILVTVLCGGNNVGAVYQPSAVFLSGGAVELISGFIFPVTICVVIFNLLSSINDKISFYGTCSAIKSLLKWTIGITVTIFSVFMTVQSQAAGLFDGIFFKATKYLVGNSVPIVGNFLSSGVDILVASASAVRSALGLLGLVILIAQVIKPITLFAAFSLMLKLLSAIAQPIGESGLTTLFDNMSKDVEFFIAGILMVAFMYALIIMLVINCANYLI
jgi:stage III sporulation protein AE